MQAFMTPNLMFQGTVDALAVYREGAQSVPTSGLLPDQARTWLARLRLLEGVPFAHLVPDSELLPPESIRFFYLDRNWSDALVDGALSVGTVTSLDREQLQQIHATLRDEIDVEERRVRMVGGEDHGYATAGPVSGFLLRSRAVSGWPALHVRAYSAETGLSDDANVPVDHPSRMPLLRLERLAPAVLLCLFDGIPHVVHIEEPRQGIQFGVRLPLHATGTGGATLPLRDVNDASDLKHPNGDPVTVNVPFRRGSPGVIDVKTLADRIRGHDAANPAEPPTHVTNVDGAVFAMQVIRFPYRQVFGDPEGGGGPVPFDAVFRPTLGIATVRAWIGQG